MTSDEHNKYLGIAFLVHGGLQILVLIVMALFLSLFFFSIPGKPGGPAFPAAFFAIILTFTVAFQLLFTLPSIIAGYALLKKKSWARISAIVAGVLTVMNIPIGTAIGVYAFWYFFGEEWKPAYGLQQPQFNYGLPQDPQFYQDQDPFRTTQNEYVNPPYKDPPDWR